MANKIGRRKIFPTFSINFAGGQLSLGRSVEAADPLDTAITQLETGVLLLSSIRYGGRSGDSVFACPSCILFCPV